MALGMHKLSWLVAIVVILVMPSLCEAQISGMNLLSMLRGQVGGAGAGSILNSDAGSNLPKLDNAIPMNTTQDRKCMMCKFSVSLVNYALKTRRGYDQIDRISNNFCVSAHLEAPLVCSKISKLFNSEITKVLTYGVVTPDQVCGLLSNNTCGHFHSPLDEWEIGLEASGRIDQAQLKALQKERSIIFANETSTDSYRVIHLSDTHVDLNYEFGSAAKCEEPLCCQSSSTPQNKSVDPAQSKAGYWGNYGFCDIPLRTFVATLKHLNETLGNSSDIEYIIWTGDIQPHDVWSQSKQTALQVYETVFSRIFKYLPNAIILPTFGNHEMVPVDSFSPSNLLSIAKDDSPKWLYEKFDSYWARWLPRETEATITRDGFYAASVRPGLRVISLNTNFCHSRNFWLFINSTDPGNQLQWLVHELQLAELAHEKVHIIGHIPPGADDCLRVWSRNYHRIIERYATTVTGQFFGHTHSSEFEMFYADVKSTETKKVATQVQQKIDGNSISRLSQSVIQDFGASSLRPFSVAQIGPSVTTFIDQNPSFRIYTVDPKKSFTPMDYETFFMNLTQANIDGKPKRPVWQSAGFFSQRFGLADITPESMHDLVTQLANSLKLSETINLSYGVMDSDDNEDDDDDADVESEESPKVRNRRGTQIAPNTDRLYELYRLFYSYSDKFNKTSYEKISSEEKKKFVCRFLTGRSHDFTFCRQMFPTLDIPKIIA